MRSIPVLRLDLGRSRALLLALGAAHLAAAGAVLVALPAPWSAAALPLLAISAARSIRRHALRAGRKAIRALELDGAATCRLQRADGTEAACGVQGSSYVSTWLVVLHLRTGGRLLPHYVVLAPDCVQAQSLRRLRVRLRWLRGPGEARAPQDARL